MLTQTTAPKFWSKPEVCRETSMPPSTLRDAVKRGEFPAPYKLGIRRIAWKSDEVTAWIASRPRTTDAAVQEGGVQ